MAAPDVFLSHHHADKAVVEEIAQALKRSGLEPWLDAWHLPAGVRWQPHVADALAACASCAVFVGAADVGAWERQELEVALERASHDPGFRVFLALLPGAPDPFDPATLSPFLSTRTWVDLRRGLGEPDALGRLVNAVRGLAPGRAATRTAAEPVCDPIRLPMARPLQRVSQAPFVGRDQELARVRQLWGMGTPSAQATFVAGEAGIGKTRLASELAGAVHGEGALVLYGRCDEGLAVPYQPWVEALRPAATAIGLDRLRTALGHLAPDLARLLPELEALGLPASADPETERYRLFEAVTALIDTAAREQRALLVLDDLHWAATPTLLLLRHVLRSEPPLRAQIVGTYRDTELDSGHPLHQLLADLQRDVSVTTVRIDGLDEAGIAAMLEAAAGHALDERATDLVRVLHAETAGNPFFVREVLTHLVESGALYRADGRWTTDLAMAEIEIPEGLRRVIHHRVARLSEPARRALAVAAVAGPVFSLSLLEGVLSEPSVLLDSLDESVAAGLLMDVEIGDYAFAHALVRQAIYGGLSSARRMRLHRQLGELLETHADSEGHVEALAHHFAHAASDGQAAAAKAAKYALAAGQGAAARLAFEDAALHYERGLKALELAATPERVACGELLLELAEARWSSGDVDKAREASRLAAEIAKDPRDPDLLARAALGFAGPLFYEPSAAVTGPIVDLLQEALQALDASETGLRARVMARLAVALAYSAPHQPCPALAHQALEIARRVGDQRTLADVLASSYQATRGPDNVAERRRATRELAGLVVHVGDGRLWAQTSAWIFSDLLERGDIDEAERELAALSHHADAVQQAFPRFLATMNRAVLAHLQGRLDECEVLAHEALAFGYAWQHEATAQAVGVQIFAVRREQGRLDELVGAVEGLAEQQPDVPAWRCALAFFYAELNRPRDARHELEALARNGFRDLARDWLWLVNIAELTEVVAFLDEAHRAERLYQLMLPYADRNVLMPTAFCLGSASRSLGLLAATMRHFDAAASHFEDALEMNARIRSPLWVAHTQTQYAEMLLRRDDVGDRDNALELLTATLATADEFGLKALGRKAHRLRSQADASSSL